ncbi:MAG: disulfide bond formation protein B [Rhodoferax sp.]
MGLEPCPMCIVQRCALVLVANCAGLTRAGIKKSLHIGVGELLVLLWPRSVY